MDVVYQVTRYGTGFRGAGRRRLRRAGHVLNRKLRGVGGPYTIDDPENPDDGATKRDRLQAVKHVKERLRAAPAGTKFVIRGANYDEPSFAIRSQDVTPVRPMGDYGKRFLSWTYLLGAPPPEGRMDCSGFTMRCAAGARGIELPHQALQQAEHPRMDIFFNPDDLEPDDFIFYVFGRLGGAIDDVALYYAPGQQIGSRPSTNGVAIKIIDWGYVKSFGRLR